MDELAEKYLIALTRIERACEHGAHRDAIGRIATEAIDNTPLEYTSYFRATIPNGPAPLQESLEEARGKEPFKPNA